MKRHLIFGFEGLLRRVMYVFDDAVVFVDPPPSVKAVDLVSLGIAKANAIHAPTFQGEDVVTKLAGEYVNRRKFTDIRDFGRQFGTAGFSDPRITSTMLAERLERTTRVPHSDISSVRFAFHPAALHAHVVVEFARGQPTSSTTEFYMRYRIEKVREAHQVLTAVLGPRVASLSPH